MYQNAYNLPEYTQIYIFITSKPSVPAVILRDPHELFEEVLIFKLLTLKAFLCIWHIFLPLPDTETWRND